MSLTTLNAYQQGGPILDKLKQLWGGIRSKADDPSLGYIGASMLPGVGEATDLVEIGAGLQDRSLGRVGLGLAGLMLPFVGAAGLKKIGKKAGDKYFSPEALSQARGRSDSKGHYVDMDPRTFLELTDTGGEGFGRSIDPAKLERVKNLIKEGTLFESSPHLAYRKGPESDIAEVFGEEGRHRAKALTDLGVESMPVRVRHVGSYEILQGNPDDYGGLWPRVLRGRSGDVEIAYPVSDPRAARKLPMDEASRLARAEEMGFDLDVYHGTVKRIDDVDPTVEMGDWTTFEKGKRGHLGRGIYVTPNADIASRFATEKIPTDKFGEPLAGMGSLYQPRVYPLTVRSGKLLDLPDDVARGIRERKVSNPRTVYDEIWNDAVEEFDNGIIGDDIDWEDYIAKGESQGAYPNTDPNFKYDMVKERVIELAKDRGYQGLRSRSVVGDKDVINMFDMKDIRSATAAQFDPSKADVGHLLAGIGGLTGARYMSNALREDQS